MPVLSLPNVVTVPLTISTSVKASAMMSSELVPEVVTVPLVMSTKPSLEMPTMPGLLSPVVVITSLVMTTPGPTPCEAAAPVGAKLFCCGGSCAPWTAKMPALLAPAVVTLPESTVTRSSP